MSAAEDKRDTVKQYNGSLSSNGTSNTIHHILITHTHSYRMRAVFEVRAKYKEMICRAMNIILNIITRLSASSHGQASMYFFFFV